MSSLYSVKYVVKVDDDSYVRLDRLTIALGQWAGMGSGKPAAALLVCTVMCFTELIFGRIFTANSAALQSTSGASR